MRIVQTTATNGTLIKVFEPETKNDIDSMLARMEDENILPEDDRTNTIVEPVKKHLVILKSQKP